MTAVSGTRLVVGSIVMGALVPVTIFLLLGLRSLSQLFTIAVCTFLSWGLADLLAMIMEKPRLRDRSARQAIGEEFDRRSQE